MNTSVTRQPSKYEVDRAIAAFDPERWAREQLAACEVAYEKGELRSLAIAIQLCGEFGWPLPPWVVSAFNAGLAGIIELEITSWDEVLGGNPLTEKRRVADSQAA